MATPTHPATGAHRPALFGELREKWPDRRPSDDNLRSYLIRKGFTQTATEQVIQFYRETLDMVGGSATAQNPAMLPALKDLPMSTASSPIAPVVSNAPPAAPPLGKPFLIGFDGAVLTGSMAIRSVKEMDRFIRILQVQRSALEAMEEDDVAADRVAEPPSEED